MIIKGHVAARYQAHSQQVIGRVAASFWRVLEYCEGQFIEKLVLSVVICSAPPRGSTLDWMADGTESILSKL